MKKNNENTPENEICNKPSGIIVRIIKNSCVFFTIFAMFLLIFNAIINVGDDPIYIKPERFLLIFPFALILSAATEILFIKSMKRILRAVIHYLISTLDFYLLLFLPTKSAANHLAVISLITLFYWIIAIIIIAVLSHNDKKKVENSPYKSVYSTSKNK